MLHEKRQQAQQLKKMGWTFIVMAALVVAVTYLLPELESNYWLSASGKKGFYVLSALFAFLGLYCLGAIWRRKNLIGPS
jgi:predicted MFS family arabinose efflux permease